MEPLPMQRLTWMFRSPARRPLTVSAQLLTRQAFPRSFIWGLSQPRETLLSTPEQNCIGLPEQKYISDAGKKGPRTGGLFLRHHAWFGLSAGMSELARRELRLL